MHATWMMTAAAVLLAAGPALGQVDENDNREGFYLGAGLGDFSSSAPLILDIAPDMTLGDVFACYDNAALRIQTHKHFDLSGLIDWLGQSGKWSGISIDSNDRDTLCEVTDFAGRMIDIPIEGRQPVGPLVICLVKTGGPPSVQLIYDKSMLSPRSVELFGEGLLDLLSSILKGSEQRITDLHVSPELRQRLAVGRAARHSDDVVGPSTFVRRPA